MRDEKTYLTRDEKAYLWIKNGYGDTGDIIPEDITHIHIRFDGKESYFERREREDRE